MSNTMGVKGTFQMNGVATEFSFPISNFADKAGFPASSAPLSVVKAAEGQDHHEDVLNSYTATDEYASNLVRDATGVKKDLVSLTHALAATRNETDRLLTLAIEKNGSATSESGKKTSAVPMGGAVGALLSGAMEKENDVVENSVKKRRVA